jgi:hypothetical protein
MAMSSHRQEALREGVTIALYVCIVLEAEFVSIGSYLPARRTAIALIWGTTIGLTLAHLFAFDLAARLFSGGRTAGARAAVWAQLMGAAAIAAVGTLPFLVFSVEVALRVAAWLIGAVVGWTAYEVALASGARRARALAYGIAVLVVAELVVNVKVLISGH